MGGGSWPWAKFLSIQDKLKTKPVPSAYKTYRNEPGICFRDLTN